MTDSKRRSRGASADEATRAFVEKRKPKAFKAR